jgi:predicted MFS family arabinose efflux permease
MAALFRRHAVLRRRAAYQGLLFGAFSLFWTAVPIHLEREYGLGQTGIGLFALAGAGGVLAAPLAGWVADRGWIRSASALAIGLVFIAFAGAVLPLPVWLLAVAAIVLDAGVQVHLVVSQRLIYALDPAERSRLNSLFMSFFFIGGACGSSVATALAERGWPWVCAVGAALPAIGLVLLALERRKP